VVVVIRVRKQIVVVKVLVVIRVRKQIVVVKVLVVSGGSNTCVSKQWWPKW